MFWGRGGGGGRPPGVGARGGGTGGVGAKKICEIGVGFSFAALSVFRLRRAEATSALWIPHWHWEPFESQGRGRRRGGREREPRRAGEGRLVWNRNSCVLIDYPS